MKNVGIYIRSIACVGVGLCGLLIVGCQVSVNIEPIKKQEAIVLSDSDGINYLLEDVGSSNARDVVLDLKITYPANALWKNYILFTNGTDDNKALPQVTISTAATTMTSEGGPYTDTVPEAALSQAHAVPAHSSDESIKQRIHEFTQSIFDENVVRGQYDYEESAASVRVRLASVVRVGNRQQFYGDIPSNENRTPDPFTAVVKYTTEVDNGFRFTIWQSEEITSVNDADNCAAQVVEGLKKVIVTGSNNDLYDKVTELFGAVWGEHSRRSGGIRLIPESAKNFMDILVHPQAGTSVGYFHSKDLLDAGSVSDYSNRRSMLYFNYRLIDSEGRHECIPENILDGIFVHELQHAANFYQRRVKRNIQDPVWLNEMLSEMATDLFDDEIKKSNSASNSDILVRHHHDVQFLNCSPFAPLTEWGNKLIDYSIVSSFGGFLLRNYPSENELLKNMYASNRTGVDLIEEVTNRSFYRLLQEWGGALLLSDSQQQVPLLFNNGTYMSNLWGGDWINSTTSGQSHRLTSYDYYRFSRFTEFESDRFPTYFRYGGELVYYRAKCNIGTQRKYGIAAFSSTDEMARYLPHHPKGSNLIVELPAHTGGTKSINLQIKVPAGIYASVVRNKDEDTPTQSQP